MSHSNSQGKEEIRTGLALSRGSFGEEMPIVHVATIDGVEELDHLPLTVVRLPLKLHYGGWGS